MAGLSKLIRKLWIESQLQAPHLMPYLHHAKELMWMRPYLTIHRLQGSNEGGDLTVDYAGLNCIPLLLENLFTDYRSSLIRNLFTHEPTVKEIGRVAAWRIARLANHTQSDLTIVLSHNQLIRQLPGDNAFVMPFLIKMVLNVQGSWEEVTRRIHKGTRGRHLRLVRKFGYEYEFAHSQEDFDLFYHQMYKPTMLNRHGELASPMPIEEAYQNFRHGYLQLIKRDNQYVSGQISHIHGSSVDGVLLGVINGNTNLIKEGALAACYYAAIHWANQTGYEAVSFEECAPFLADGLFQYKRGWGAAVTHSEISHHHVWLKIQRDTPAVRQFLKENPFLIIGENRQLQGLIFVDDCENVTDGMRSQWRKQYATPGLEGLFIRSLTDFLYPNNHH